LISKYLEGEACAFPKRIPRAATDAAISCDMLSDSFDSFTIKRADVIGLPARRQSASLKYDITTHASSIASSSMKSRAVENQLPIHLNKQIVRTNYQ
jgi:hypothetical protein